MGFLDGLLRSVKREVERDVTRHAVDAAASSISNAINNTVNQHASNANTTVATNGAPVFEEGGPKIIDGIDYAQIYHCDRDHFRSILKESFPDMTLTEDVPVKDFVPGANGAYCSVEFLLSDGSTPKVAIQLRSPHQSTKAGTQMLMKQHGIGYISLWTDYKNQKEYIEKRVKDCLWN